MGRLTGPAWLRIQLAGPFLPRARSADLITRQAEAAAAASRAMSGTHACTLCGAPARWALLFLMDRGGLDGVPLWADMCPGCADLLRQELGL